MDHVSIDQKDPSVLEDKDEIYSLLFDEISAASKDLNEFKQQST